MPKHPTCFISYSWDNSSHKAWVRDFASRLRAEGIDARLDQWHAVPGDQLPQFMETAIRENDFIIVVCTPAYKERADGRIGGVGYEGDIITGEVLTGRSSRKVIPVLREGLWETAAPSFCLGKYFIDLSSDPYSEEHYQDLVVTLLGNRDQAPTLGPIPQNLLIRASRAEKVDKRILYPIEYGAFLVPSDASHARASLLGTLRDALIEVFADQQIRFTAVLWVDSVESNGMKIPAYQLWSHQRHFVFSASRRHSAMMTELIEGSLSGGDRQRLREYFAHKFTEHEDSVADWTVESDVVFDHFPRAHWINYEPSLRRVQIKVDRIQSPDPKQYDNKVRTTSEALTYACAFGGRPVAFLGDIAWLADNFSLLKLTSFIIDKRILDFERFRILGDDPETWDFQYPELEAEMKGRS